MSRNIDDLETNTAHLCELLLLRSKQLHNIDLIITSTYRSIADQNILYAQGRTAPGKIVTYADGGQSLHNWRVAFDVVPIIAGKAVWNDSVLWKQIGAIGRECGLEWGGDFKKIVDKPHFQLNKVDRILLGIKI